MELDHQSYKLFVAEKSEINNGKDVESCLLIVHCEIMDIRCKGRKKTLWFSQCMSECSKNYFESTSLVNRTFSSNAAYYIMCCLVQHLRWRGYQPHDGTRRLRDGNRRLQLWRTERELSRCSILQLGLPPALLRDLKLQRSQRREYHNDFHHGILHTGGKMFLMATH